MPLPIPNLDDKTFTKLFEEARALIPRYAPDWTEHNLSDPGITFIDLFAWLAEMQIYFLNRVTDENFLKFLKLLGETPAPAKPARADVTFRVSPANAHSVPVPAGTRIAASDPLTAERIIFETDEDAMAHPITLGQVLTYSGGQWADNTASNDTVNVFYFAFGAEPGQGDALHLGIDAVGAFPSEKLKLTVNIFDADLPVGNEHGRTDNRPAVAPSAELEWHYWSNQNHWKPLQVSDDTVGLTRTGRLGFTGPEDIAKAGIGETGKNIRSVSGAPLYWLRATVKKPGYEIPPRIDTVLANTVSATHGRTIRPGKDKDVDESAASNGLPFQTIRLRHKPVLRNTLGLAILEEDGKWHMWHEVADFDASGPEARHFTIALQEGLIQFGDGIHGRIPPAAKPADKEEENIKVSKYRIGGGEKGNVRAGAIEEILDQQIKGVEVTNRRPASGGVEPESLSDAKSRVRGDFKRVTRAITSADFETLALRTPGLRVARAQVLPQYHPRLPALGIPGAVTVVIVPQILPGATHWPPTPSSGFLRTVFAHLKSRSLITGNLHVIAPEFVEVSVTTKIRIDPKLEAEKVRVEVREALSKFLNPLSGGPDGTGWPFGRSVFKSEIYQVIESVGGVTCVDSVSLSGRTCDSAEKNQITLRKIGLVYSGQHEISIC
ncbi:MAG: putative baseplate assembly protein [Blastocatellia bacterium]